MSKQTTGVTISRLGVLTVLVANALPENHLDAEARAAAMAEIRDIATGKAGIPPEKILVRSMERCAAGGACIGYMIGRDGAIVTGLN